MTKEESQNGPRVEVARREAGELRPTDVVRAAVGEVPYVLHRIPGGAVLGLGEAVTARSGPERSLRDAYDDVRDDLASFSGISGATDALQIFFQVAFDRSPSTEGALWGAFDRLKVVCPRVSLRWSGDELTVVRVHAGGVERSDEAGPPVDIERVLEDAGGGDAAAPPVRSRELTIGWPGMADYRSAIQRAIRTKAADKVVIARLASVSSDRSFDPYRVLASLGERYGSARLFAVSPQAGADAPVFLGASPERLIRVEGGRAETMALAGTAKRHDGEEPAIVSRRLMRSAKDRDEHNYVTKMIARTLADLGCEVDVAGRPRPMILPNVVHLETPISARLPQDTGLVDLVDALHPTPAVCGTPTDVARRIIHDSEPFDRGLYAGALGWTNLEGDGDVTVALRCGLIDGPQAHLFAGGGITAGSTVEDEVAETESKFLPVLEALQEAVA